MGVALDQFDITSNLLVYDKNEIVFKSKVVLIKNEVSRDRLSSSHLLLFICTQELSC